MWWYNHPLYSTTFQDISFKRKCLLMKKRKEMRIEIMNLEKLNDCPLFSFQLFLIITATQKNFPYNCHIKYIYKFWNHRRLVFYEKYISKGRCLRWLVTVNDFLLYYYCVVTPPHFPPAAVMIDIVLTWCSSWLLFFYNNS